MGLEEVAKNNFARSNFHRIRGWIASETGNAKKAILGTDFLKMVSGNGVMFLRNILFAVSLFKSIFGCFSTFFAVEGKHAICSSPPRMPDCQLLWPGPVQFSQRLSVSGACLGRGATRWPSMDRAFAFRYPGSPSRSNDIGPGDCWKIFEIGRLRIPGAVFGPGSIRVRGGQWMGKNDTIGDICMTANSSNFGEREIFPRPGRTGRILWPPSDQGRDSDANADAEKHDLYSCWTCAISENRRLNSAGKWTTRCYGDRVVSCVEFCSVWVDPKGQETSEKRRPVGIDWPKDPQTASSRSFRFGDREKPYPIILF